jgi:hypothetical protein
MTTVPHNSTGRTILLIRIAVEVSILPIILDLDRPTFIGVEINQKKLATQVSHEKLFASQCSLFAIRFRALASRLLYQRRRKRVGSESRFFCTKSLTCLHTPTPVRTGRSG